MNYINNKKCVIIILMLILIESCTLFLMCKSFDNKKDVLDEVNLNTRENIEMFAIMVEQADGSYKEELTWPPEGGYVYNSEKSGCIDINGNKLDDVLTYDITNNIATVDTSKTTYCYLYFNKDKSVYAKVLSDYSSNNGVSKLSSTSAETGNTYDVYYYTGNITNNNILYGGFCWKMVITTETNGVKLIYNGIPTASEDGTKSCDNTGKASQFSSTMLFNNNVNSLAYVGYMYNKVYTISPKNMSSITDIYKYGNSFEDKNNDGVYELKDTIEFSDWAGNYNTLNNNHYTCFNTTGECENLYYIFRTDASWVYSVTLTGGKTIEEAINEMLYAEDVNKTDSTIKDYIDTWYEENLLDTKDTNGVLYSKYLENAIFCNSRSISNISTNGWNPNGGNTTNNMVFKNNILECENKTDRFTLKKGEYGGTEGYGNNALDYPVGLISSKEASLAYAYSASRGSYLKSGVSYWTFSVGAISSSASNIIINESGSTNNNIPYTTYGVRPVVSLSSNVQIVDGGDGSVSNPYEVILSS